MVDSTEKNSGFNSVCDLIEERINRDVTLLCILDSIRSLQNMLWGICNREFQQSEEIESNSNPEDIFEKLVFEMGSICKIGKLIQSKFSYYENTILSMREENRDLTKLLKVAIMEKKSKNRTGENKRGAIMQIAEKGLQKVGFGFVMGVLNGDSQPGPVDSSSDGEEDAISLIETVESIMKNLRIEITDLRRALEDSRWSNEQLQALVEEQAQKLKESEMHIKDLQEIEALMSSSVEELRNDVTTAGEEITRWREACELEVEAGKSAIKERDKELALLKHELGQTKKSLETSNNKLQLKERLAATAMAAQTASETCLRLADSRSASLRDRVEELTKQLEGEENKQRGRGAHRRARYACWPWQRIMIPHAAIRVASLRVVGNKSVPEMEALLRLRI